MKLLLTGAFIYSESQLNKIKSLGFEIVFVQDERVPLQIDVSDIDAVVCNGLFLNNYISKFKKLKFIQLTSTGLDRVPLDYIKDNGINIYNAKGVYKIPMAEWVVLKILEIYKKSRKFYEVQRDHKWEKQRDLLELTDKTVSIIGFGCVGAEIAKRLRVFDMNIIGVGRREIKSQFLDEYYLINDIDDAIEKSDIIILTLPLTNETRHIINAEKIARMQDNTLLINISRGGVIDEAALIDGINSNKFLGVALDVFEEEPLQINSPFWNFERVVVTPHNSFVSDKVNERLFKLIISNLQSLLEI